MPMRDYSKILVCLDLSDDSERIAERAQCIAKRYGASLTLLKLDKEIEDLLAGHPLPEGQ
jgi:K+-sensing histidine kinase KdpD